MSWSLNVGSQIAKDAFDAAVDAAVASPQNAEDPNQAKYDDAVGAAKAALKTFATKIDQDYLNVSASGHVVGEGTWPFDSINISISGAEAPPAEPPTPAEVAEAAEEADEPTPPAETGAAPTEGEQALPAA